MHHADLVAWDTERRFTLTNDMLHHDLVYPPAEGMDSAPGRPWCSCLARWWPRRAAASPRRDAAFPRCEPPEPARSVSA